MKSHPRVTLLTDFGTRDGWVGALKGVLAEGAPDLLVDDVAHDIPRGDADSASRALARYWRLYPERTVHLVVVDPGVGTTRRALGMAADGRFVVAPDNGCATSVLAEASSWSAVELVDVRLPEGVRSGPSTTFHGRDVFAPAAAALAAGRPLETLGPPLGDPVRLSSPRPVGDATGGRGVVLAVDRFGNLLTNLPGAWLEAGAWVEVGGRSVPAAKAYGDVAPGEGVALVSSDGRVEVAVRDGSAAEAWGLGPGTPVRLLARE